MIACVNHYILYRYALNVRGGGTGLADRTNNQRLKEAHMHADMRLPGTLFVEPTCYTYGFA